METRADYRRRAIGDIVFGSISSIYCIASLAIIGFSVKNILDGNVNFIVIYLLVTCGITAPGCGYYSHRFFRSALANAREALQTTPPTAAQSELLLRETFNC